MLGKANCVDPEQMPQKVATDQGLHCLLKEQELKGERNSESARSGAFSQSSLRDNIDPPVLSVL